MKSRLVDPVHVFDSKGRSLLGYEKLERENQLLRRQVERLTRILRARNKRDEYEIKPRLH